MSKIAPSMTYLRTPLRQPISYTASLCAAAALGGCRIAWESRPARAAGLRRFLLQVDSAKRRATLPAAVSLARTGFSGAKS